MSAATSYNNPSTEIDYDAQAQGDPIHDKSTLVINRSRIYAIPSQIPDAFTGKEIINYNAIPAVSRIANGPDSSRDRLLKTWIGTVIECAGDRFTATLIDQTGPEPEMQTEFYLSEICEDDISLVVPGGVFYWHLYQTKLAHGQVSSAYAVRFRRTVFTKKDAEWSQRLADEAERAGLFE